MPTGKTHWFLKTKNFGLVIGFVFSVFFCLAGLFSGLFGNLESKILDTYFSFKGIVTKDAVQKGVWHDEGNPAINQDIMIVGIDLKALQKYGSWPFPRTVHGELVNSFARILNQDEREKALFLDIFFIDNGNPSDDAALAKSIADSNTVFLETILENSPIGETIDEEMFGRQKILFDKHGSFTNVRGDWKNMNASGGIQTNLAEMNRATAGYGVANVVPDEMDKIVRRQPLVAKYSKLLNEIPFEALGGDFSVDESLFERMSWFDKKGFEHQIDLPLTEDKLTKLKKEIYKSAPPLMYDADGDGSSESETRVIEIYQDYFMPSITFSLALRYWGCTPADCEIIPGKRITVKRAGKDEITIPVDENCAILINYMGGASSIAVDGPKTFPVRSYAGYARETAEDRAEWPETRSVAGKVLMVGAFDKGMADDEKQTPYGMMFGIEIHANSLNTLLTGNFIRHMPTWLEFTLTVLCIMLIAFIAAWMKDLWSLPVSLVAAVLLFLGCSLLFDELSILYNYSVPFTGMVFTYITIVLYRRISRTSP